MTRVDTHVLLLLALAALAVVCATVLAATGTVVPEQLWLLATAGTTGAAGLAPGPSRPTPVDKTPATPADVTVPSPAVP